MNIREAILKAADHIERNPGLYDFHRLEIPDCGTPACMMGWIGFFAGKKGRVMTENILPVTYDVWFKRLIPFVIYTGNFCENNKSAAKALRLYADKYHPADKQERADFIPSNVRGIFEKVAAKEDRYERSHRIGSL